MIKPDPRTIARSRRIQRKMKSRGAQAMLQPSLRFRFYSACHPRANYGLTKVPTP